jgi:predicted dehydrogenase
MNAHTVDLARFLVGEIGSLVGDEYVFVRERNRPDGSGKGEVTADDATSFMVRFENGAMGSFTATRFATGRKNYLRLEIFGSQGSLVFNLERLNELEFFSREDQGSLQGFRNIMVTEQSHPYLSKWWPPGHIIGWEHTFIHEMGDFLTAIAGDEDIQPSFYDGWRCQQVLDAVSRSDRARTWIDIPPAPISNNQ